MVKVIEVIIRGIINDLGAVSLELKPETNLRDELKLTEDKLNLIRKRIGLVFGIQIPKEEFLLKSTYNELCDYVHSIYKKYEELKV